MEKEQIALKIEEALSKKRDRKFTQSVEAIFNFTGAKMEGEHKLNLQVALPKGRGKDVKVGFFADGDLNVQAKKLTNDVLSKNELEEYTKDKRRMKKFASSCYSFMAQADMMGQVGKSWGIVLGPRGKMPHPVPPKVNIEQMYEKVRATVRVRSKKLPTVQVPVGTEGMSADDIAENILAIYVAVERVIPKEHISSLYVKTTMGEAVRVW